jgi:KipI family sensor histidine kinase inhibitor
VTPPRLHPLGDAGLVCEFGGDDISEEANAAVRALRDAVEALRPSGLLETVPTYRSLLLIYDPVRATAADIRAVAAEAAERADPSRLPAGRLVEIPCVYGGAHGPDLAGVAADAGLSESDVIALHAGHEYRVYMLGFMPGFPYMGILPPPLRASRLSSPRTRVPGGTVAIAGQQTGVYPMDSPGGWRLIGRTPLRIYDPARPTPFLLDTGDRVRFVAMSPEEYERQAPAEEAVSPPPARPHPDLMVERGGLFTTVQDLGRPGYRRFGLPRGGAMDSLCLRVANLLLGNPQGAAALEFAFPGPRLVAAGRTTVALGGADFSPVVNGRPVAMWTAFALREGDVLEFERPRMGQWCYLAVPGGIDVPAVLGSRATYVRASLGGYGGRRLQRGDRMSASRRAPAAVLSLPASQWPAVGGDSDLRVVPGPQNEYFAEEAAAAFLGGEYRITPEMDRLGYRLEGPPLAHRAQRELLSDGLLPGAIQVPSGGQPIIIMPDGPTTGGYPKIATIVGPDLRRLAQTRRAEKIQFRLVEWERAHEAARDAARYLSSINFERSSLFTR